MIPQTLRVRSSAMRMKDRKINPSAIPVRRAGAPGAGAKETEDTTKLRNLSAFFCPGQGHDL
jgi:hypothetical protein